METVRSEQQIFVKTISKLLESLINDSCTRGLEREQRAGIELPIQEFVKEVVEDLLTQVYELGQRDMKIGLVMTPLMAMIKKAAAKQGAS